jgi:transcriptional regulator with XRE-family HTH domain
MATKTKGIAGELRKVIATAERTTTQYRLAKLAGMPQSQFGRVASGETMPTLPVAERIARAAGYRLALVPIVAK